MLVPDASLQGAEWQSLFLAQLPRRLVQIQARGERQCRHGWDINALALLADDTAMLTGACAAVGETDVARHLRALADALQPFLDPASLPDAIASEGLFGMFLALAADLVAARPGIAALGGSRQASSDNGFALWVVPPQEYWRRFAVTTQAPDAPSATAAAAAPVPPLPTAAVTGSAAAFAEQAPDFDAPRARPAVSDTRIVCHLGDGDPLSQEIDRHLEAHGQEVNRLDTLAELKEILTSLPPHLVIVDATFEHALEEIGALVRNARRHIDHRIWMVALSLHTELGARLHAMRAGCDAFIALPTTAAEVSARIAEITETERAEPYRILIVEDDRSQALFAESILRKSGMQTLAITEALAALDELDRFRPDLILMDLYMPECDGMELTALIREREAFLTTPIVFLSGEHDTDKHFAALDAGGDDFLSKPIRPRHLIAAVTNRVRRARQLQRRGPLRAPEPIDATAVENPTPASATGGNDLAERIRNALSGEGLQLAFQPIVSLNGDGQAQFQALLRLEGGDGRLLAATELVPVAERAELIADIDRWVLTRCVETIGTSLHDGRPLRLFASQSLASMREDGRADWLRGLLDTQCVPGEHLSLELRLADAVAAPSEVRAFAAAMKALGLSLTLAGVETGEAGVEWLEQLPVDFVKLAAHYGGNRDGARSEVRAIVSRAHACERRVIAPQVEDARAAAALWSAGVDFVQGNFVQQAGQDLAYDFQASA